MTTPQKLFLSLASAAAMLAGGAAMAVSPYWSDSTGTVVRDGFGDCVQSRDWRPDLATVECGAEPPAPAAGPTPPPEPEARAVTLSGTTNFAFDSAELSPAARAKLDQLASQIRAMETLESIQLDGHTCNIGTAAYNQGLSERRAASVRRYLIDRGVDANKIRTTGYGLTRPAADNATREGRSANRRVEIVINGTQR